MAPLAVDPGPLVVRSRGARNRLARRPALPPKIQAKISHALAQMPSGWRLARIVPTDDGECVVAEIADESGQVVAHGIVALSALFTAW